MQTGTNTNDGSYAGGNRVANIIHANDFYNTPGLQGKDLEEAVSSAKSQQEAVLAFFKKRPQFEFTPFEVLNLLRQYRPDLIHQAVPITSIRRAITNLTRSEPPLLVKTKNQKPEKYGSPNFTWKLYVPNVVPTQLNLF